MFFSTLMVFIFILIGVEAKTIKRSCDAEVYDYR